MYEGSMPSGVFTLS